MSGKDALQAVADEQAALRRVATLVARGVTPEVVFDSICEEMGRLVRATITNLAHFTSDGNNLTVAGWSVEGRHVPAGTRLPLQGGTINVLVHHTGAPSRVDSYDDAEGELAELLRRLGIRSEVGAPVIVDGNVWGALIASSDAPVPMPAGTEVRVASFAELAGMAIANATTRADLIESRARIVAATDAARRRIQRDLHDGAQQHLVNLMIQLDLAEETVTDDPAQAVRRLQTAKETARDALNALRELAAGVHPPLLTSRGLRAAVTALTTKNEVPVIVDVPEARYPPQVEAAAYFLIAEALSNAAKHARATKVEMDITEDTGQLLIDVRDDGIGGARRDRGSGLEGLTDRIEALGGTLRVESPFGGGTRLRATLPITHA